MTTFKKSIERTSRWAERGLKAHRRPQDQGLFGIVQGAGFEDLRRQSAHDLVSMDFQATLSVDWPLEKRTRR